MIHFDNVTKKFGEKTVLDKIQAEIEGQEFVVITGPSGAGKSTFLHLLIGAEKPTSGTISVDDFMVNELEPNLLAEYRRKLGMVYQDYRLLPHKTVDENVAFALEACGYPDEYVAERTDEVLRLIGIAHLADRFPRELSGGEKQKTSIARALVHDPKLIIADEPTGNLDPQATKEIMDIFHTLHRAGATVILATHDPELIQRGHRVLKIENRRVKHS